MKSVLKSKNREVYAGFPVALGHYSKPVALVYRRGRITKLDLRAAHQLEQAMILIENEGLQCRRLSLTGAKTVMFESDQTQHARLILSEHLELWLKALFQRRIPAGAILDLVIERHSFYQVDKRFRKTNGWARERLIEGLKLWTTLFFEGDH